MKKRDLILQLTLYLLAGLAVLSVGGAFAGAARARVFFNSTPLAVFWIMLLLILIGGFIFCRPLRVRPGMLMTHLALVLILAGGLWGSQAAHEMRGETYKGYLFLFENTYADALMDSEGNVTADLPFRTVLEDFRIHYYDEPAILIADRAEPDRGVFTIPAEQGQTLDLGDAKVTVVQTYDNLQLRQEDGTMRAVEGTPDRANPGYELVFEFPDARREVRYVFERFAGHDLPGRRYHVEFVEPRMVKDYISTLAIESGGEVRARKAVEVNKPLHYGGFHFYQSSWGRNEQGEYSVIEVVSDSGLTAVFTGYGLLALGICGQFWLVPAVRYVRRRKETADGD